MAVISLWFSFDKRAKLDLWLTKHFKITNLICFQITSQGLANKELNQLWANVTKKVIVLFCVFFEFNQGSELIGKFYGLLFAHSLFNQGSPLEGESCLTMTFLGQRDIVKILNIYTMLSCTQL